MLRKSIGDEKESRKKIGKERDWTASLSSEAAVPSVFQGLLVPEPVFFCTVEPASATQQKGDTKL